MTKHFLVVSAVVIALAPAAARRPVPQSPPPAAQRGRAPVERIERLVPFRVGEELAYDITWSSFITATAATATIAVREKRPAYGSLAYYLVAEGRPTPFLAALYSLYYKVDTWLDAYTLLPLRTSMFSQERARRQNRVTLFDHAHGTARYEAQPSPGQPATHTATARIPPQTQDPLSAVYNLRLMTMKTGARTTMPMTFNGVLYQMRVTVDGRESMKTPVGTLTAWRLTPTLFQDGRATDSPRGMRLWISDDARRLPIKMEVEISSGSFILALRGTK